LFFTTSITLDLVGFCGKTCKSVSYTRCCVLFSIALDESSLCKAQMNLRAVDAVFPVREKSVNRIITLENQVQRTQRNLGTLTQFEQSEN
jgi:hypothetical protein